MPRWSRAAIVAVICAAVVGGLALALAITRSNRAPPRPKADHRVALQLPPVEAALWFAERYPEYFRSGEDGLGEWLAELDAPDREFVLAMAQTLTWAWVEHELGLAPEPLPPQTPARVEALAQLAMTAVRHKTLNQLELNLDHFGETEGLDFDAYLGDERFAAGVFARLVRGASNCEGQNHLVALIVDAGLEPRPSWLPQRVRADMAGVPGHDLVRVAGPGLDDPVFVDAWSNLPAFRVSSEVEPVHAGPAVAGLGGRGPRPAAVYREAGGLDIEMVPDRDAPELPVDLDMRAPSLEPNTLAATVNEDPWRVFVLARILHVYDDPRAAGVYELLLAGPCRDRVVRLSYVCKASERLAMRL